MYQPNERLYLAASNAIKEAKETPEGAIILPIEYFRELEMAVNSLKEKRISQLSF